MPMRAALPAMPWAAPARRAAIPASRSAIWLPPAAALRTPSPTIARPRSAGRPKRDRLPPDRPTPPRLDSARRRTRGAQRRWAKARSPTRLLAPPWAPRPMRVAAAWRSGKARGRRASRPSFLLGGERSQYGGWSGGGPGSRWRRQYRARHTRRGFCHRLQ